MVSKSAEYYGTHPAAIARNAAYDTKFESSPAQKANRMELARLNAAHDKKYGNLLAMSWMLHIPNQESCINHHR